MEEKTVLITGASRGIGEAIARAFAQKQYHLILTCKSSIEKLRALSYELSQTYHILCEAYEVDMGDYAQVAALFSGIKSLDVLINNAGISYVGLLSDMEECDWHRVMSTNLDACFYTAKFSIPLLLKKHAGSIINISSVWGNTGASTEVAYSASKAGMNGFTKALAKELAPSNIAVNAIACGVIDTDMNKCFSDEDLQILVEEIPAGRMGRADEIAQVALSLAASPTYLTGQIITIDGGWY